MTAYDTFQTAIIVMLFYGVASTLFAYSLPDAEKNFLIAWSFGEDVPTNYYEISEKVEKNFEAQAKVGAVDVGVLVMFSGNLVLDLLLNTFNAIPSMAALFIKLFFQFFPIDENLAKHVILGVYGVVSVSWVLAVIQFITSVRTGRGWV